MLYSVRPVACKYQTIAGDRSNQFGLLTEHKSCHKLLKSISIDSRYCNRFINIGRPIVSLNHSVAICRTVFTIPTTFRIAHARCYIRAERATKFANQVGSSLLDALTVPLTHYVPKIVFIFSPIYCGCTIYLVTLKDLLISQYRSLAKIRHYFLLSSVDYAMDRGTRTMA